MTATGYWHFDESVLLHHQGTFTPEELETMTSLNAVPLYRAYVGFETLINFRAMYLGERTR